MISVQEAEQIILFESRNFGIEEVELNAATGRVLAEEIKADRDLPPYNRVTMDGIAIHYTGLEDGNRSFSVKGTQAAGDQPIEIDSNKECVEIMTGASLPISCDTIIRYEDLTIENGTATINIDNIRQGQNIHYKGIDKKKGQVLFSDNHIITPAMINTLASVGKHIVTVKKPPKVVVLSTGDELVDIDASPSPFQIRRSNSHTISAVLQQYHITPTLMHVQDVEADILATLSKCLQEYDVLILSGGVSMGKYDYLPTALDKLGVKQLFHKVKQRPGKPFWFGTNPERKCVFAFPGNAVSAFMCMYRYCVPWLNKTLGLPEQKLYAVLNEDYQFDKPLQYFLQVQLSSNEQGQLVATPSEGNGSGDFVNLLYTQAFMELPEKQTNFKKGEAYRVWLYQPIIS